MERPLALPTSFAAASSSGCTSGLEITDSATRTSISAVCWALACLDACSGGSSSKSKRVHDYTVI